MLDQMVIRIALKGEGVQSEAVERRLQPIKAALKLPFFRTDRGDRAMPDRGEGKGPRRPGIHLQACRQTLPQQAPAVRYSGQGVLLAGAGDDRILPTVICQPSVDWQRAAACMTVCLNDYVQGYDCVISG